MICCPTSAIALPNMVVGLCASLRLFAYLLKDNSIFLPASADCPYLSTVVFNALANFSLELARVPYFLASEILAFSILLMEAIACFSVLICVCRFWLRIVATFTNCSSDLAPSSIADVTLRMELTLVPRKPASCLSFAAI